jgi:hypothetical protein
LPWFGDKGAGRAAMKYGQTVGMRWRSAILLSPLALFSKARKHFVPVSYRDPENLDRALGFEPRARGFESLRARHLCVEWLVA